MAGRDTRPPRSRRAERFIGACGGSVAAACPERRFEGRISEPGAERSVHWPLTLMNSARGARRRARAGNAGLRKAAKEIGRGWLGPERSAGAPAVAGFKG